MAEIIFWFFLFLIIYTYFLYPLILVILQIFFYKSIDIRDITPDVSLIITAYNEEKNMREKIKNCLNLDYPKDKLEIIVASDCSTDNTDNIVKEYKNRGIKLARLQERKGKTVAQNYGVTFAKGEILIFSDAPTIFKKDAIKKLVRNYNDKNIGCVTGDVIYTNETDSIIGEGGSLYWRYESWIKKTESNIGSILGAAGCIYSMRRCLYTPFDENYQSDPGPPSSYKILGRSLDDDFLTPIILYTKNIRSVMEPEAISTEKTSKNIYEEFKMRRRVITRSLSGLLYMKEIMNPFKFPLYSFQLYSHKILRWFMPISILIIFISNLFLLENKFYFTIFLLHLFFYLLATLGYFMDKAAFALSRAKLFYIPLYFCIVNLAVLMGIIKYFIGKREKIWTPVR